MLRSSAGALPSPVDTAQCCRGIAHGHIVSTATTMSPHGDLRSTMWSGQETAPQQRLICGALPVGIAVALTEGWGDPPLADSEDEPEPVLVAFAAINSEVGSPDPLSSLHTNQDDEDPRCPRRPIDFGEEPLLLLIRSATNCVSRTERTKRQGAMKLSVQPPSRRELTQS